MKDLLLRYGVISTALLIITLLTFQSIFKAKTAANDVMAQTILRTISNSLEQHKTQYRVYPSSIEDLVIDTPPFYVKLYFEGIHHGFTFNHEITDYDYLITATPASPSSGTATFQITTGGQFQ